MVDGRDLEYGVDVVAWLQAEMKDMLDWEICESVWGPVLFNDGSGVKNWVTYRGRSGTWLVREMTDDERAAQCFRFHDEDPCLPGQTHPLFEPLD